jgi:hypothetical protein
MLQPLRALATGGRVGDRLMDAITEAYDGDIQMIDSTSIRAHEQAATLKSGVEIIVSVAPGAASQPRFTRSSTGKVSRSDARPSQWSGDLPICSGLRCGPDSH